MNWFLAILGICHYSCGNYSGPTTHRAKGNNTQPPNPLDPISLETVGRVRLDVIHRSASLLEMTVLLSATLFLTSKSIAEPHVTVHFLDNCADGLRSRCKGGVPQRETNKRYAEHLSSLRSCGITSEIYQTDVDSILNFSSYFSVPKNEEFDRAIFNGKAFSELWNNPPNMNTADISSLLKRMQQHVNSRRKMYVVSGDLRHWFHQLRAPDWLRDYLGIHIRGGRYYKWNTIPMGLKHSPWCAQSIAWCLLACRRLNQQPFLNEQDFQEDQLPTFVTTVKQV